MLTNPKIGDLVQFADDPMYVRVKRIVKVQGKRIRVVYNNPKTIGERFVNSVGGMWLKVNELFRI